MKKIISIVAVILMTAMSAQAQSNGYDTKHEVAISYGIDSNSQIIDVFETIGGAMVGARFENESFTGPISAEYFYHVKNWLGVGGILAYGQNKQDVYLLGEKDGVSYFGYPSFNSEYPFFLNLKKLLFEDHLQRHSSSRYMF